MQTNGWSPFRKSSPVPIASGVCPLFLWQVQSVRSCVKFFNSFECIFCIRLFSFFFFAYRNPVFIAPFKEDAFSPVYVFGIFVESQVSVGPWISGSVLLL